LPSVAKSRATASEVRAGFGRFLATVTVSGRRASDRGCATLRDQLPPELPTRAALSHTDTSARDAGPRLVLEIDGYRASKLLTQTSFNWLDRRAFHSGLRRDGDLADED
jgi:hypothetical protein